MKKIHGCLVVLVIFLFSLQAGFAQDNVPTAKDLFQQGLVYEKQAAYGEAINLFTSAIELDPNYADAYLHRGMASRIHEISATGDAIADFTKVIELDPKNAEAYYQRGLVNDYAIYNEAAKSDMITAAGLGHEGAKQWLLALNKQGQPVATPAPAAEEAPTTQCAPAASQGFDLADYLPGGIQPIVYFDFNKSGIKGEGFAVLDAVAALMKEKLAEAAILVVGHTDSTGTEKYNAGLSLRRAEAVKSYLTTKHGIAPERISAEGYGEMAPADTNETDTGRTHNRRAAIMGIQK